MKKDVRIGLLTVLLVMVLPAVSLICPPLMSKALATPSSPIGAKAVQGMADDSQTLSPITVTARKREENLEKIPMSIRAFSSTQIEDADIGTVQDVVGLTPNLHMKKGASANVLIIRGISNDADFIHSTASLYVDDVSYPMNFMQNPNLFDIERIEVLRGPQGALYGRNSESGVINIVTRRPGDEVTGKIFTSFGAYDPGHGTCPYHEAGVGISGPVVADRFYLGFSGRIKQSDGYIKNRVWGRDDAARIDQRAARVTAKWTPSPTLELFAGFDLLDNDDGNGNKRYVEGPYQTPVHEIAYDSDLNINTQTGDGQNLRIRYSGPGFDLLSVTGRRWYENHMLRDSRCSPVDDGLNDLTYSSDQISQEIRISSPGQDTALTWLGGVYLFREDNVTDIFLSAFGETRNTDMQTTGYALFGQATLALKERFHLTWGLRISRDEQEGTMAFSGINKGAVFTSAFDDDVLLPKFSLAYDVSPGLMAYTTVSRGYNSGGFNSAYATGDGNFTYGPEFTWNYEAGLKFSRRDNRLLCNLAFYYIRVDDKQVAQRDGLADALEVKNAAKAHSKGFELEVTAKPLPGLDLFGGVGYTRALIDEWNTPGFDYAGMQLPNAPEFTGHLGIQYRSRTGLFARTDLVFSQDYYSDAMNTQKLGEKRLVNLRVGYEAETYDIVLWCKNLFAQEYETMGFARRFDSVMDGEPRSYGISLAYRF